MPKVKYAKVPIKDFHALAISSHRYAMGRQTYIVSWTVDILTKFVRIMDDNTLYVLLRDTSKPIYGSYGDEVIDKPEWMKFKEVLRNELIRRGKENFIKTAEQGI